MCLHVTERTNEKSEQCLKEFIYCDIVKERLSNFCPKFFLFYSAKISLFELSDYSSG